MAGFNGSSYAEPGMQQLNEQKMLRSLIGRFDNIPEVRDAFDIMHRFLLKLRYWSILNAAL